MYLKTYNAAHSMCKNSFDIIMYTNNTGLGVDCVNHAHRLPFIKGIAKAMNGIGKVLVVLRYRSIPQCWFDNNEKSGKASFAKCAINQLDENLWAIRPTVIGNLVLASYLPPLRWLLLRQQRNQINHAAQSLKINNRRVAWMTHPYHYLYRGCAEERAIVYECHDEFVFDSLGRRSKRTELVEIDLARHTILNITTAKPLYDKLISLNKNTRLISNGVMHDLFSQCRTSHVQIAPEARSMPHPVIGMIGNLYRGYDFELLNHMVIKKPSWSFVFVGQIAENARNDVDNLSKHSNFHIFGWRPYEEIPTFLKGFDVAIIPYQVNDWTNTINPNKVYDYFSAGVPVVATPITELQHHKEYISLCSNVGEFIEGIEQILCGDSEDRIKKGIRIAESLSWEAITLDIVNELKKLV